MSRRAQLALLLFAAPLLQVTIAQLEAPAIERVEFEPPPVAPEPPPDEHRASVADLEPYRWRYKPTINAGELTHITTAIAQLVALEYWRRLEVWPVVTGATVGVEYEGDNDHTSGCALDFRTFDWMNYEQRRELSLAIAEQLVEQVDAQGRVVLWYGVPEQHADHIHVEVQDCGDPIPDRLLPAWSLNGL